jgi:hypothetical protein
MPTNLKPIHVQRCVIKFKIEASFTLNPKSYNFNFVSKNPGDLLLPFIGAFVIEHIFTQLLMDPSMVWHLRQMNKSWYLVADNSLAWKTLEIVRLNVTYHQSITKARNS